MKYELTRGVIHYIDETKEETEKLLETLCRIPAPSNHEEKRAEFCRNWLASNGAENVYIDDALNVVCPINCENRNDIVVFMAHTDTVFPDTEPMPFNSDGEYFYSSGVGDDTACLAMLMMTAKYVIKENLKPDCGILFVANSGEEGLGNLRGVRQIMKDFKGRIACVYTFDGKYDAVVTTCVGSHRYRVTVKTEGGHSFNAFGNKSAIHFLAKLINNLCNQNVPKKEGTKTTYNVGVIEGGTSVNTIAQEASMLYEYRSDSFEALAQMKSNFEDELKKIACEGVEINSKLIGERPCSDSVDENVLTDMINKCVSAQEKYGDCKVSCTSGSTDCNIPMSMGVPAVCAGTYDGHGSHTREEKVLIQSLPRGMRITAEIVLGYFNN